LAAFAFRFQTHPCATSRNNLPATAAAIESRNTQHAIAHQLLLQTIFATVRPNASSPSFMSSTRHRTISKCVMRTRAMQSQKRIRMNYKYSQAMQSSHSIQHQFTMRTTRSTLSISQFEHLKAQKSMLLRNTFGSAERKIKVESILHVNKNAELAHDFFCSK
jgi:hypothetical protein